MNVDDLYGTLYVPKDGTMDPAGTCTTLSRAATARGATVMCAGLLTSGFIVGPAVYTMFSAVHTSFITVDLCVCDCSIVNQINIS